MTFSGFQTKKWSGEKTFDSNEKNIAQTNAYFETLNKYYYLEWAEKLETRFIQKNQVLIDLSS